MEEKQIKLFTTFFLLQTFFHPQIGTYEIILLSRDWKKTN